jgi:hypothetical protein
VSCDKPLFLFGRLGDHFYGARFERAETLAVAVKHLHVERKMLPLVGVRDEQRLCGAKLFRLQMQRLQLLILRADADERVNLVVARLTSFPLKNLFLFSFPTLFSSLIHNLETCLGNM